MLTEPPVAGTSGTEPPRGRGLLLNRNFAYLAVGQAISNIGDFVYSTTLLIWVFALGGSAAAISGVLVAQYVPIFILGPLAGVFVDRWHRLRTMLTSDLARAVITLLPLFVPGNLRLPAIYGSVFLISSISRFFMPAMSGVTQVIVSEADLPQAASLSQVTQALSIVIGPAIASPLYFAVGPVMAVILNACSYLVSAICLQRMRVPRSSLLPEALKQTAGIAVQTPTVGSIRMLLREMWAGFAFVLKTRILFLVTILGLIAMFGAGAINSLDIIFVSQRLHADPGLYGYLTAVGGVGTLVGAICAGLLAKRIQSRYMLAGSVLLLGIGLAIYALQVWFVLALIFAFLISLPQGGINVGLSPLLMRATPRHLMGRVQSVLNTGMFGASLLSIALAGYLGLFVPAYLLFLGGSIIIFIAGLFGWFALPAPEKKGLEEIIDDSPLQAQKLQEDEANTRV